MPTLFPACCHRHALPAMPIPTSLLPAVPGLHPSDALFTGRREIPTLARPARPPSPALYVCVCGGRCDVPVPVSVFRALGSLAMRLLQRSIDTAVALLAFPVSVSDARVVCCLPSRLRMRYAVCCPGPSTHPTHGTHTHLTHHTDYTHTTHFHTPHIHHTPHLHHTTSTHHTHSSTTRHPYLRIRKSGMVCSL